MAKYSDDPIIFKKDLRDAMYAALNEMMMGGGIKTIVEGSFTATYRSPKEIQDAISKIDAEIHFAENGCQRTC